MDVHKSRNLIPESVKVHYSARVINVSRMLKVSKVTIRQDLTESKQKNFITKVQ